MEPTIDKTIQGGNPSQVKFTIGVLIIIAAIVYLIISSTQANAQYFLTVEELASKGKNASGRNLRVSGAVIGDSIQYNARTLTLSFEIAHVPGDNREIEAQGGLAKVLHEAVIDPNRPHLHIIYVGVKPDLLQDEAQAIVTGKLGDDGNFYAQELLLKCPTRYEEELPEQSKSGA